MAIRVTPHMTCTQMAVTAAAVTENVHMSRRWKDELVGYGICIQPTLRVMYLLPLKPVHLLVCPVCPESLQHHILTSKSSNYQTMHQNRLYE
jgi:hypothetical protein